MGRLIDETDLMNLLYDLDDARHELFYAIKKIPELPTVEAIPKAEYEARLKADMVAMLTEIQFEIEDFITDNHSSSDLRRNEAIICCTQVIQQKINEVKGDQEGEE